MENQFTRTELLLGPEAMERLSRSRVIVFGVGGVGGYVVEVLARSGVGMLALVDNDRVAPSNLNRQIIALHSTLSRLKVDVLVERIHDINPQCEVRKFPMFYLVGQMVHIHHEALVALLAQSQDEAVEERLSAHAHQCLWRVVGDRFQSRTHPGCEYHCLFHSRILFCETRAQQPIVPNNV